MASGDVVEDGVGRVGVGGEEERHQHDAGFAAAAAPGAKEQDTDQAAEDDLSGDRENLVDLFQDGRSERKAEGAPRSARRGRAAAVGLAGEAQDEFERDGHEDAAETAGEDAIDRSGMSARPKATSATPPAATERHSSASQRYSE